MFCVRTAGVRRDDRDAASIAFTTTFMAMGRAECQKPPLDLAIAQKMLFGMRTPRAVASPSYAHSSNASPNAVLSVQATEVYPPHEGESTRSARGPSGVGPAEAPSMRQAHVAP